MITSLPRTQLFQHKIFGCIVGGAVGDALGMPRELVPNRKRERLGSLVNYQDHPTGKLMAGQWTDDTLLSLATLESIIDNNGINISDITERMRDVILFEPQRGAGRTTRRALQGLPPAGRSAGNGAAMRIAPVALYSAANLDNLKSNCEEVSHITHTHRDASDAAVAVAFMIAKAVRNELKPGTIVRETREFLGRSEMSYKLAEVEDLLKWKDISPEEGITHLGTRGLALESVGSAVFAFLTWPSDFTTAVLFAVNNSFDSDTIGSITGAISGAHNGICGIPRKWVNQLEQKSRFFSAGEGLCHLLGANQAAC